MRVSNKRQDAVRNALKGIKDMKSFAVKQMLEDMDKAFTKQEEIIVFNQAVCGMIAVSRINGVLKFIFSNGTCSKPIEQKFDYDNYELVYCAWEAFFNHSRIV